VIADEFHLFGGQGGKGFAKFRTFARHLQAPLVMLSATPNYNDAERCYCIETILDPQRTKGGFLAWLYKHCNTVQNNYSMTPLVDEDQPFRLFKNAAEYLAALPGVYYVEDDLVYTIQDVPFDTPLPWAYEVFGYNERKHRLVASQMEDKHTRIYQQRADRGGQFLVPDVEDIVIDLVSHNGPTLIYANHSTVAEVAARTLGRYNIQYRIVTGDDSKKDKARRIQEFKDASKKQVYRLVQKP
jgi:superfamily II DNA or RNA helicase